MPRVGEPICNPRYPWDEWAKMLNDSSTGALYFGPDDFSGRNSANFRNYVLREFRGRGLDISTRIVGSEVVVQLNA